MSALYRAASIGLCTALLLAFGVPAQAQNQTITVFAAASMKNALDDADNAYMQDHGQGRRQLCREFGAGQADRTRRAGRHLHFRRLQWMDYVAKAS